jgi:hypothetical protein
MLGLFEENIGCVWGVRGSCRWLGPRARHRAWRGLGRDANVQKDSLGATGLVDWDGSDSGRRGLLNRWLCYLIASPVRSHLVDDNGEGPVCREAFEDSRSTRSPSGECRHRGEGRESGDGRKRGNAASNHFEDKAHTVEANGVGSWASLDGRLALVERRSDGDD